MKTCNRCLQEKPLSEFPVHGKSKGHMNMCIICHKKIYLPWNRNVNRNKPGCVYLIQAPNGLVKIGITKNVSTRLGWLKSELGFSVELLFFAEFPNAGEPERNLHILFKDRHSHGEWFDLTPEEIEQAKDYLCHAK